MSRMRVPLLIVLVAHLGVPAFAQLPSGQSSFEVASVRPSQREVGPDYDNQIKESSTSFSGQNVTLRRLIAEAWQCQRDQVIGPAWLDRNEYDVEARLPDGATRDQMPVMLRNLLSDRFRLKAHREVRQTRVYELKVGPNGPRIESTKAADTASAGPGIHFHGDMRQFAALLAIQLSIPAPTSASKPVIASGQRIPVLDKTGLEGIYDFNVDVRPEIGTDGFTFWKRMLEDQLGLKVDSSRAGVEFVIVDAASAIPSAN